MPRSQHVYRILQMAIGILVDLGLDDDPETTLTERHGAYLGKSARRLHEDHPVTVSDEAARIALGCFYVSSTYVILHGMAGLSELR